MRQSSATCTAREVGCGYGKAIEVGEAVVRCGF